MIGDLNQLPSGYMAIDQQGNVLEMNHYFKKLLGINNDHENIHLDGFLSYTNKFLFYSHFYPKIKMDKKVEEMFIKFQSKTEEVIPVLINAEVDASDPDEIIHCAVTPVRKRIQYEQEMKVAHQKVGQAYQEKEEAHAELEKLYVQNEKKNEQLAVLNEKLKMIASTDELTQINNRRAFVEELETELVAFENQKVHFSLIILDIDFFKKVNDTWGHLVGDQVLIKLAEILKKSVRKDDFVARYGGEEFVLILKDADYITSLKRAEEIRIAVQDTDWEELAITISLGVSTYRTEDTKQTLLSRADFALYESKKTGRNCVTHAADCKIPIT
ncbi:sensor domain-containing diguanylate cyclase [Halalkalibacillus halophilus]|uniref:sensor domain-containing diguanylate cyclase n=1 Tax=Halalkalibacillus halophilus TaxID=392827 RepID=UPI00041AA5DD|nr:sensor domain-containing diguanylate cyclase [Halalkalibacillus halophilus]